MSQTSQITVLNAPPKDAPDKIAITDPPSVMNLGSSSGIQIELLLRTGGAAVGVRPWYYRNGNWWGLGVDAATPNADPLVADPSHVNGNGQPYGQGRYIKERTNVHWCLVRESGLLADIDKCFMYGGVYGDIP